MQALHPHPGQLQQGSSQRVRNQLFPTSGHQEGSITCAVPRILSLPRRGVLIPPWRRMEHTAQEGYRELGMPSLQARRKGDLPQSSTTWRVIQRRWSLTFLSSGQQKIEEMFINHSRVWGENGKKAKQSSMKRLSTAEVVQNVCGVSITKVVRSGLCEPLSKLTVQPSQWPLLT